MNPDQILLTGLRFEALIGVYDWERTARRPLVADLALELDLRPAGASDAVVDTVDYAAVSDTVRQHADDLQPQLLEAFAETLCVRLLAAFPRLLAVTLTLHKPGILPDVDDVAIRLRRARQ